MWNPFKRKQDKLKFKVIDRTEGLLNDKGKQVVSDLLNNVTPYAGVADPEIFVSFVLRNGEFVTESDDINFNEVTSIVAYDYAYDGTKVVESRTVFKESYLNSKPNITDSSTELKTSAQISSDPLA